MTLKETEHDAPPSRGNGDSFDQISLERLGRERPASFSGAWPEIAFCFSIVMSQILAVGCAQLCLVFGANLSRNTTSQVPTSSCRR